MNIFQIIANFIRKILTPPIEDESQVDSGITIVPNPPAGQQPILKSNNTVGSSNLTAPSQSYIPPISTQPQVDVLITRQKGDSKQTPGNLLAIVQGFACSTLELPWLNNAHSISCIPDGIYKCVYTYQGDLKEYHYELQNVPDRDGIFMHEGNYFFNSEGCILLGVKPEDINHDGEIDITTSKPTVLAFEEIMGKKDFILKVQ